MPSVYYKPCSVDFTKKKKNVGQHTPKNKTIQ